MLLYALSRLISDSLCSDLFEKADEWSDELSSFRFERLQASLLPTYPAGFRLDFKNIVEADQRVRPRLIIPTQIELKISISQPGADLEFSRGGGGGGGGFKEKNQSLLSHLGPFTLNK